MTPEIALYACPRACSFVSHAALEHTGAQFEVRFIDLFKGEQNTPDYRGVSPRGKVPFLTAGSVGIGENIAILAWINRQFPQAGLLPDATAPEMVPALSDLGWFASGVHPFISRILVPQRFTTDPAGIEAIRASAQAGLAAEFALIDEKLGERQWWWSDRPSAADFYLFWFWARVGDGAFDREDYANYRAHVRKVGQLPAVQRTLLKERTFLSCYENLKETMEI
ncbi:MAG: glutathione S-transferase family protein [Novosphingobium sp.]